MKYYVKYSSVSELRRNTVIPNELIQEYTERDVSEQLQIVEGVVEDALAEENWEERCVCLVQSVLLLQLTVKQGRFLQSVKELVALATKIGEERKRCVTQLHRIYHIVLTEKNVESPDFGPLISPRTIMEYAEDCGKRVLIMDFRESRYLHISYNGTAVLDVLPIALDDITPGVNLVRFLMNFSGAYLDMLADIWCYDQVVLMTDDMTKNRGSVFKRGTKSRILYDLLRVSREMLEFRQRLLVMDGGFPRWRRTFPKYVSRSIGLVQHLDVSKIEPMIYKVEPSIIEDRSSCGNPTTTEENQTLTSTPTRTELEKSESASQQSVSQRRVEFRDASTQTSVAPYLDFKNRVITIRLATTTITNGRRKKSIASTEFHL